jgi:hypothetical protein
MTSNDNNTGDETMKTATSTGNYKGIRYTEISGEIRIDNCRQAPSFWSIGAMQRWIDNNADWCCPANAGG